MIQTSINELLKDVELTNGSFETLSETSLSLKNCIKYTDRVKMKHYHKEGIDQILHTLATLVNGDVNNTSNWDSLILQAILIKNQIIKEKEKTK